MTTYVSHDGSLFIGSFLFKIENINNMNTNEKGKAFEDNVYNYFKQLIDKRYFGFDSTRTKIHKQYSAYSKDRENYDMC